MPTKTVKVKKKGVIVSIYVEKPTNRRKAIHHHHHYHVHNSIRHHQTGNNTNRRAELLLYSHRLRESARSSSIASPFRSPITNVGGVQRKSKESKAPTCPVNWKIFNLGFCRSLKSVQIKQTNRKNNQAGPSIKSMIKSFQATKKKGLFSRFLSVLRKRR